MSPVFHLPLFKRVNVSTGQVYREVETNMRRNEIIHYTERLKEYQIEVSGLPESSPTEFDARQNAIKVARIISKDSRLRAFFLETKTLPIHELGKQPSVYKEVIQNYPKYITAMTLLFLKDYPHINGSLTNIGAGDVLDESNQNSSS